MICPKCGGLLEVLDTRYRRYRLWRRRNCMGCGYRFSTYELIKPHRGMMKSIANLAVEHIFKGKQKFTVPEMVALKKVTEFGYQVARTYAKGKL